MSSTLTFLRLCCLTVDAVWPAASLSNSNAFLAVMDCILLNCELNRFTALRLSKVFINLMLVKCLLLNSSVLSFLDSMVKTRIKVPNQMIKNRRTHSFKKTCPYNCAWCGIAGSVAWRDNAELSQNNFQDRASACRKHKWTGMYST